jgi:nucleoside-diphosphate-sugar epimerase
LKGIFMKILVTGGAGYIGSTLVPKLLQQGHSVTVVDNLYFQQTTLLDCCKYKTFEIIRGDVRDANLIKAQMKSADAIVALAALVGAPLCAKEPRMSEDVNLEAIRTIVQNKSSNQMLLYPCTNSGYGIGQEGIHCDEKTPLNPVSAYGRQKVSAEKLVLEAGGISFRLATVFGMSPRMRLDLLVNDFTYRAVYDGFIVLFEAHFKRNYLHVQDAAKVFIHGLTHYDKIKGEPYNVGLSDANISKQELCEVIAKIVPKFTYLISEVGEDPDKRNYIVSNQKIESTGYSTDVRLADGIQELIKGYQIIKRTQFANF